jgi:phosphopentomutase
MDRGLLFVNLVDFDMLWGHRNDVRGYARALEEMDRGLPALLARLREGDLLALTADHGCDPTTPSTDHSREYVPLLVNGPGRAGVALGTRSSFSDLGATVAGYFGLRAAEGTSFLAEVTQPG